MKLKSIMKNKNGAFADLFLFMIFMLIFLVVAGIMIYAGSKVQDTLNTELDGKTTQDDSQNYTDIIENTFGNVNVAYQSLYWIAFFLAGAMILGIFVGSYMVTTKPVVFVPYLVLVAIAVVTSVAVSNAYEEIATADALSSTFAGFTGANYIMFYLPLWISVIGIIGGIIMIVRFQTREDIIGGFG